jgi:hypothetical protein
MSNSPSPTPPVPPGNHPATPNLPEAEYKKEFLEAYGKFSATLRQWLGGYAAGMFAFLALNDTRWKALITSGQIRCIGLLLLIGIASQLLAVFLYKTSNSIGWLVAAGQKNPKALSIGSATQLPDRFGSTSLLTSFRSLHSLSRPISSSTSSTPNPEVSFRRSPE